MNDKGEWKKKKALDLQLKTRNLPSFPNFRISVGSVPFNELAPRESDAIRYQVISGQGRKFFIAIVYTNTLT
jgi:hypothetical protein